MLLSESETTGRKSLIEWSPKRPSLISEGIVSRAIASTINAGNAATSVATGDLVVCDA